jgi:soluble lytic murein transglycosylase-like protein
MQKRILVGLLFLLGVLSSRIQAEDNIQAFVNKSGKTVFTNINAPNGPAPPSAISGLTLHREEMPENIRPLVETISHNYGIDPNLVSAVMKTESNFNRWAVSRKGARGLMQLIPETGRRFGVSDFFDPQQNIEGGVRYLRFLLDKFGGNVELSLAGYNAGENLVARLGRVPSITETRNYVRKISAMYRKPTALRPTPPAKATVSQTAEAPATPDASPIFRNVDERGVVHYSNIEPLN